MQREHFIDSFEELNKFSKLVFNHNAKLILLHGDLGAGKTTFVANFIKENLLSPGENFDDLGVMSPTFSLINQYQTKTKLIVHSDMYRLKKGDFEEEELSSLIDDADYTFIEWPSKLKNIENLTEAFKSLSLNFELSEAGKRKVLITPPPLD